MQRSEPVHSQKLYRSLKILGSKVPLSGHLEALSNGYWVQAQLQRKMNFPGLRSRMRHRGPRLARRHPNGESEGILEGPTPKVRPDLRRDMVGIPEISGPQETEKDVEHTTEREHLHHGGSHSS
jgi:hypothetical protein